MTAGGGMRATTAVDSRMKSNSGAKEDLILRGMVIHADLSKSLVSAASVADEGHTIGYRPGESIGGERKSGGETK